MSCKCLRCLRRVGTRLHHAGASAGSGRLGGSVSHFELQKHESSFKPALFTALIGCGGAQSSECTACFSKDAEKPAEISLTCHKVTQTIFVLLL